MAVNVEANKGYGVRGISSGRMAHFGNILTKKQIDADHRLRAEPVGAVVHTLSVLAAEGIKNRDLWYPTILGVLVVVAAVGLFVGTPILLLATNMGTRLGFLVGVACLSGLMVLISLLWLTNPSPVNTLKGRIPAWVAVESIQNGDVAKSKIAAVRDIDNSGRAASEADVTNLKAAVDSNLILTKNEQTGEILSGAEGKFAVYTGGHRLPRDEEPGHRRRRAVQRHERRASAAAGRGCTSACTSPSTRWSPPARSTRRWHPTEVPFGAKPPVPKCGDDSRQLLVLRARPRVPAGPAVRRVHRVLAAVRPDAALPCTGASATCRSGRPGHR